VRVPPAPTTNPKENDMLSKQLWAAGLSLAVIAMMGAPAGALPG
jgi:hypothetical protein